MWPFGPKQVRCAAGRWTPVISSAFVQMPTTWEVHVEAEDGGAVDGAYEVTKTAWLFPTAPDRGPLMSRMVFQRGWFNTFYKLMIRPVRAVVVTIR